MTLPIESITGIDDCRLIEAIRSANERLVVMAPGLSDEVAAALCDKWKELGRDRVKVILDVDAEVCRLGYGTLSALQRLEAQARELITMVAHQPGVRIGLVATESSLLLYAPIPLLVEAGPRSSETTNAIQLDFVPEPVRAEIGLGDQGVVDQTVGLDRVPSADVEAVAADLERNPPMKFDVARTVRVFNAQFEFVELEVSGCLISRKSVPVPADLLGIAKDERTRRLLRSSFRLLDDDGALSGNRILKLRNYIADQYLISLRGYGQVVLRAKKEEFLAAVATLERYVARFQTRIEKSLQAEIERNKDAVVEALLPGVIANPPNRWRKYLSGTGDEKSIRVMLERELSLAYGSAQEIATKMKVTATFKGVTYELLTNAEFTTLAQEKIPSLPKLHEEFDAARALTKV